MTNMDPDRIVAVAPPRAAEREARAKRYFTIDLNGQNAWYSQRASQPKNGSHAFGLAVISAGPVTGQRIHEHPEPRIARPDHASARRDPGQRASRP